MKKNFDYQRRTKTTKGIHLTDKRDKDLLKTRAMKLAHIYDSICEWCSISAIADYIKRKWRVFLIDQDWKVHISYKSMDYENLYNYYMFYRERNTRFIDDQSDECIEAIYNLTKYKTQ